MKKLLQIVAGQRSSPLLRAFGRRYVAGSAEEYAKRNYANNASEYNTAINSLIAQRRSSANLSFQRRNLMDFVHFFLSLCIFKGFIGWFWFCDGDRHFMLRHVYDDMMLDGVQPSRDIFHSLIVGAMKGARLQDAIFYRDQMKILGLVPDVALYNFLISLCGKWKYSDQAIHILEEMKINEVKPTRQTYICLLNACAASGGTDRVYAIFRDMTAAGLGLNKFCYAGLIAAHKNKIPLTDDTASKIIELVEQSKGWSSIEDSKDMAENGVSEEELYNIPTAEYVHRRGGFLNRQLTVYHVAFHACADLRNVEAMETLLEMLNKDDRTLDDFLIIQTMRCYLHSGNLDRGLQIFKEYMNSGRPHMGELFVTLIEGAMVGYTPKGMEVAQDTLAKMKSRGFYLTTKMGSDLLQMAAGEKTGGYTTANYIWDLMQARKLTPLLPAVEAYYHGLIERKVPEDDARLKLVYELYYYIRLKNIMGLDSRIT